MDAALSPALPPRLGDDLDAPISGGTGGATVDSSRPSGDDDSIDRETTDKVTDVFEIREIAGSDDGKEVLRWRFRGH
jgi:hypothetical protein